MKPNVIFWHAGWFCVRVTDRVLFNRLLQSKGWSYDPAGIKCGFREMYVTRNKRLVLRFLDKCDRFTRLKALEADDVLEEQCRNAG